MTSKLQTPYERMVYTGSLCSMYIVHPKIECMIQMSWLQLLPGQLQLLGALPHIIRI